MKGRIIRKGWQGRGEGEEAYGRKEKGARNGRKKREAGEEGKCRQDKGRQKVVKDQR